jgi:opacity protein-like surface antigen
MQRLNVRYFILFLTLYAGTLLSAESKIYVGVGAAKVQETVLPYLHYPQTEHLNTEFSAKIGYGARDSYAAELSLNYLQNDSRYFAEDDGSKLGFNISLLKAYDFDIFVHPFLRAGFGAGTFQTDADATNNSLTYGNFHLGGGLFIPLAKQIDIEVSYEYRFVSFEKIDLNDKTNPKSHINALYTGLNFRF